ncbi:MAG: RNA polymerase sigma factor [Elusimicrobiota bacterium]
MQELNKDTDTEVLIEKAKAGNKNARGALVKKFERKVYNIALKITSDEEEAGDVVQETFKKVLEKLDTFRGDSKFSTWLYRVTVNTALMKKRKEKRKNSISLDKPFNSSNSDNFKRQYEDNWTSDPLNKVEKKEIGEVIDKAIQQLPDKYRPAIILKDIQGFSNKEGARIMNISVPAFKSRAHRARLKVREKLDEYFKKSEVKNGL